MLKKQASYRNERGQSLIELAVSLPVMALILMGVINFGMATFTYSILRDAAQEGAFYGSFNPSNKAEIEIRARNISPRSTEDVFSSPVDLRDKKRIKVDVKTVGRACQGFSNGASNSVKVSVSYDYPFLIPFIGRLVGTDTIKLTGVATNIILQPPCP